MRVLVNALTAAPGGSISVLAAILRGWPGGDDLLCLAWREDMVEEIRRLGVDVQPICARSTAEALAKVTATKRRLVDPWNPDVAYSQQYFLPRIKITQAVHHRNVLPFEPPRSLPLRQRPRTWGASWSLRHADCNIFNSHVLRSAALRRHPWLDPDRTAVVHNAIDTEAFFRGGPRPADGTIRIVVPQGDMRHKRNDVAIDVLVRLLRDEAAPDIEVTFAGAGDFDTLRAYAAEVGVGDRIRFAGYLSRSELAHLYSTSSLVLITSEKESFCNPIVEAHAVGVPVVASPLAVINELPGPLTSVASGFGAESLAEAVTGLLRTDPPTASMVRAAREFASRFHPRVMASKIRRILAEVASTQGGRQP